MLPSHALRITLALVLASPVLPQTTTWLEPGTYATRSGADWRLTWESSESVPEVPGAARAPRSTTGHWRASEVQWLFLRDGGTQRNVGQELFEDEAFGQDGVARLRLSGPGVALVGIDRAPRTERVAPAQLERFLARYVSEAPVLAQGEGPVTVRRVESAKLLVRVLDDAGRVRPSAAASSKSGQRCEIRPLLDPTRGPFGGDLPFRVYLPAGCDGVRVRATHLPTGDAEECLTDAEGLGHFRLRAAGEWRVEAHRVAVVEGEAAGLELQSATLAFEIPGPGPSGPSGPSEQPPGRGSAPDPQPEPPGASERRVPVQKGGE